MKADERFPPNINVLRSRLWVFYPTADDQDLWLDSPHPLLGGDSPFERIAHHDWDAVWALVDQLESGAVV